MRKQKPSNSQALADDTACSPTVESFKPAPTLARIQSRDSPDEAHQALDKAVLKTFKLYTKHNDSEVPDWPGDALQVLSNIVNNDKRLSPLSVEETAELLKHMGCITVVLEKGWNDSSFKEVHQLGMLPCSQSNYCHQCCYPHPELLWDHKKSALPAGYKSTPHEGKFWSMTDTLVL
jgi:hypothetical protein